MTVRSSWAERRLARMAEAVERAMLLPDGRRPRVLFRVLEGIALFLFGGVAFLFLTMP